MIVRHDHLSVILGQLLKRASHEGVPLLVGGADVAARLRLAVVHCGKGGQVLEIEPLDESGAVPTLRAHQHERLVRRDPEEPSGKARIPSERPQAPNDLEERSLEQIAPVLVPDRVTHELSFDVRANGADEAAAVTRLFLSVA